MYSSPESGSSRERYLGLAPTVLAETAEGIWQKKKEAFFNSLSKPVALGLVMKGEGRDILRSVLSVDSDIALNIAPNINFILNRLMESDQRKFRYGFGEVVLGSIIEAVERGIFEWDDEVFVADFNEAIIGTPIPRVQLSDLIDIIKRQKIRTAREQSQITRTSLDKDPKFLQFLENSESQHAILPQTIHAFIYSVQPFAGEALEGILPVYKEALSYLKPI